jgi:thiol-disulfide isomerase/thioredoxin
LRDQRLVRFTAAALLIGVTLLALWQAGVIFDDADETATTPAGETVAVEPADISVETENALGLKVGAEPGAMAPDFEFSAFDGSRQRLSDYRGRAVFLNFWATWCIPCRAELPDMEAALRTYGDRLAVVAVNNGESLGNAQRFLNEIGVELTAFAYDPEQAVVGLYGLYGMPMSYFIDAQGVITRVVVGQVTSAIMRSAIEEALTGAARAP